MSKSTVFVAVHGIGDQVRNETIQAVARRVYEYEGKVSDLPLGAFLRARPHPVVVGPRTGPPFPAARGGDHCSEGHAEEFHLKGSDA